MFLNSWVVRLGAAGVTAVRCTVVALSLPAMAVMAWEPSAKAEASVTVKTQFPPESAVVLPRELPSAKTSTLLPASAVPVKVGVESLVKLSVSELPVSEAATKSGVDGRISSLLAELASKASSQWSVTKEFSYKLPGVSHSNVIRSILLKVPLKLALELSLALNS